MPYKDAEARAAYMKEYRQKNREKMNEANRKSRITANRKEKDRERYANDLEYRSKVQAKNKEQYQKHKTKRTEAQRLRRRENRKKLIEYKGGCCVMCGTTENLQFDHIDRKKKSFDIGKCLDYSWERLTAEADKCVLLCKEHHEIKSTINHDRERLAEGWRVVDATIDGDEMIVRLKKDAP